MNKRRNMPIVKGVAAATIFGLGVSGHRETAAGVPAHFERALRTTGLRRDADGLGERRRLGSALPRAQWVELHKSLSGLGDEILFSPDAVSLAAQVTENCFVSGGIC
jgi:endonuclease III